jgi:hypothetical protein
MRQSQTYRPKLIPFKTTPQEELRAYVFTTERSSDAESHRASR